MLNPPRCDGATIQMCPDADCSKNAANNAETALKRDIAEKILGVWFG